MTCGFSRLTLHFLIYWWKAGTYQPSSFISFNFPTFQSLESSIPRSSIWRHSGFNQTELPHPPITSPLLISIALKILLNRCEQNAPPFHSCGELFHNSYFVAWPNSCAHCWSWIFYHNLGNWLSRFIRRRHSFPTKSSLYWDIGGWLPGSVLGRHAERRGLLVIWASWQAEDDRTSG